MPYRRLVLPALTGAALLGALLATQLLTVAFSDYENEVLPPITALLSGHVHSFAAQLPAYGGSVVMRAPFALAAHALGLGELGVARALALPCLLAALCFGVAAWAHLFGRRVLLAAWAALLVATANPLIMPALTIGHPEELLGGVLCAAAVVAALRDRDVAAGILLGLAGANKAWALFAIVPVMVALSAHRARAGAIAAGIAALLMLPTVVGGGGTHTGAQMVSTGSVIFQPWQVWWFLGHHGAPVIGLYGIKPGFRTASAFPGALAHPLVVAVPLAVCAALLLARRARRQDAMLLLALCFALRCALDPWNTAYYELPLVFALLGHEAFVAHRMPLLAAGVSAAAYLGMTLSQEHLAPDAESLLFLAWALPLVGGLLAAIVSPDLRTRAARRLASALPTLAGRCAPAAGNTRTSTAGFAAESVLAGPGVGRPTAHS